MERKKIFNIANYKDNSEIKFGMLCKTEDEAKTFCNYLDSLSKQWLSTMSYAAETYWDNEPIIYYFNCDTHKPLSKLMRESNEIILTFSDFDWSLHQHSNPTYTFQLADLKDGQIVKVRSGEKYIKVKNQFINSVRSICVDYYTQSLNSRVDRDKDIIAVYDLVHNLRGHLPISLDTLLLDLYSESEYLSCVWSREVDEKPIELTVDILEDYFGHPIKIVEN